MPLSEDGGTEEIGDDYTEPPFDLPITIGEDQPEPTPVAPPEPQSPYQPYDLAQARPSIYDPVEGEVPGKRRLVNDEGEVLPEFDQRYAEDFEGLAFIGALAKTFEWLGHKFLIRTITVDEALAVALLTRQYADTMGAGLAYRTAVCAMAVQAADGRDLPVPVGASDDSFAYAQQRFDYAKARWFQFTVDAVYTEYLELELRVRQVVDAMGKASAPTVSIPG